MIMRAAFSSHLHSLTCSSIGSDTHMSLYTCGDRQSVDLGLAIPIPDTTYLYFMYRQPMDMVLQDPMLAMHHHNVHN